MDIEFKFSVASCVNTGGGNGLASFPGLPRFFCSSVSVDNNTRMWKGGKKRALPHPCIIRAAKNAPFRIRVLLSMETEEQKKTG